jgi:LuxR family maltose regulon positive regulatory protein
MVWDSLGKKDKADQVFARLRELAYQFDATELDDIVVEMFAAHRNIALGDLKAARQWADHRIIGPGKTDAVPDGFMDILVSRLQKYENLILGRLLVAEGRYSEALDLLEQVIREAERTDRMILLIDAETQRAIALHASNRKDEALAAITRALRFAEPEGLMRIFLDQGTAVQNLLKISRAEIDEPKITAYIDRLLEAFQPKLNEMDPKLGTTQKGLSESLSDREIEVLHLLPSDLSSTEMADNLAVSVNTLRTHLKNIYAKLGAHSRYEAIARARDAGLL